MNKGLEVSIGYKTSVNHWLRLETIGTIIIRDNDVQEVNWNNELFIRQQTDQKEMGNRTWQNDNKGLSVQILCRHMDSPYENYIL